MSRYFKPPAKIREIGRRLRAGSYAELAGSLRAGEVLFAVFDNTVVARTATLGPPYSLLAAVHVDSQAVLEKVRSDAPVEYYAVPLAAANSGMDAPIR